MLDYTVSTIFYACCQDCRELVMLDYTEYKIFMHVVKTLENL